MGNSIWFLSRSRSFVTPDCNIKRGGPVFASGKQCQMESIQKVDAFDVDAWLDREEKEYLRKLEKRIDPHYLRNHPDVNLKMRELLFNWIKEVLEENGYFNKHSKNHQKQIQSYLIWFYALSYFDLFMSCTKNVSRKNLQLIGSACLWVATKIEAIYAMNGEYLVHIGANAFSLLRLVEMERTLLITLGWKMNVPTIATFVDLYIKDTDKKLKLLELLMKEYLVSIVPDLPSEKLATINI